MYPHTVVNIGLQILFVVLISRDYNVNEKFTNNLIQNWFQLNHNSPLLHFGFYAFNFMLSVPCLQDCRSPDFPYRDYRGHLCLEWEVANSAGPSSFCYRWSSPRPCKASYTWHTTCWSRTWRNYSSNIWDGSYFYNSLHQFIQIWKVTVFPEVLKFKLSQVYPMYKAFIEPDLQTAQIKISNKFNPFTGFQSPTYILKVRTKIAYLKEMIKG